MPEPIKISVGDEAGNTKEIRRFPPETEKISIGRDPASEIKLDSPEVSARHAEIISEKHGLRVRDLGSINGVYLNGRRMRRENEPLRPGDRLTVGPFTLVLETGDQEEDTPLAALFKPKGLIAVMLVVIVALLAAWVLKSRMPSPDLAANEKASPLVPGGGTPAAKAPEEDARKRYEEAGELFSKGESDYFLGNMEDAAESFRKVLELDPENVKAANFLAQIQEDSLGRILDEAYAGLEKNELGMVNKEIARLEKIEPANPELQKLEDQMEADRLFQSAKDLYFQGQVKESYEILASIHPTNQASWRQWLGKTRRELSVREGFREVGLALADLDYKKAGRLLDRLKAETVRDPSWTDRLKREQDLAALTKAYVLAAENGGGAARMRAGELLLKAIRPHEAPGLHSRIEREMQALKEGYASQRDSLRASAEEALETAGKMGKSDPLAAHLEMKKALDLYTVLAFLDPGAPAAREKAALEKELVRYVKEEYQQGYILVNLGQYAEAAAHFRTVVAVDEPGGRYSDMARAILRKWTRQGFLKPDPPAERPAQ